jgi:acyl-CoA synthetase (AMP-forming)/AMP-acid ligase II
MKHDFEFQSLPALLQERVRAQGSAPFLRYLQDGSVRTLSFEGLHACAVRRMKPLKEMALPGERVLIGLSDPCEFVKAFFATLYAGAIPVPVATPRRKSSLQPLETIAAASGARAGIFDVALVEDLRIRAEASPMLSSISIACPEDLAAHAGGGCLPATAEPHDIAFLQFTSGSTSAPKGVMVTHGNLLQNQRLVKDRFGHSSTTVFAGWLPLHHDMGFIGNVLQPLYLGIPVTLISPVAFMERPVRLLKAISESRATTCGMPNFGYLHCVQRVRASEMEDLDLSTWQVAFNGSEPIRASTLSAFADKFAKCGFRRESFYPCYGLAEATLFVAGWSPGQPWVEKAVAVERPLSTSDRPSLPLVASGFVNDTQDIRIVNADTAHECAAGQVGEIWIAGPCVAKGYWNAPADTAAAFGAHLASGEGPFLRTGDLGLVDGDRLYITGRLKDLIIVRGKNHYPQDIEASVEACSEAFVAGSTAAFMLDESSDDRIVVVQEVRRTAIRGADEGAWRTLVRDRVARHHQLTVAEVAFVLPNAIPRTSSGKIQRGKCRALYLKGELEVIRGSRTAIGSTPETSLN